MIIPTSKWRDGIVVFFLFISTPAHFHPIHMIVNQLSETLWPIRQRDL